MSDLKKEHCEACREGAPRVTPREIAELSPQVPEWKIVEYDGERQLERTYKFPDFARALAFVDRVGHAAEEEDHHPTILLEWGKVKINWWSHKIKGLHRNDFIMAAKCDELYEQMMQPAGVR